MAGLFDHECAACAIRVVICDDHELIRQALRTVIDGEPDMEIIGEASDGNQAVALAIELRPDAIVMDIEMPGLSGIEATRRIKKALPDVTILVLTVHDSYEYVLRILEAGASAYLTKGIVSRDIPNVIRAAMNGESTLSEDILKQLINYALEFRSTGSSGSVPNLLTDRELELILMVAEGKSNKVIAKTLNLSENTVKKYMMSIFDKLGVHSRTAAVIAAQQVGLLTPTMQPTAPLVD